ncbi:MAG: flagellar hook-associated protein FlgK [Burkholderiales bacterium]|nr:flagellar hook-associated protein FlgK [Burkholderiales bacterium]
MSANTLMSLGSRAMGAAQVQLQTTGHNITNASVDGYSRQKVSLTTASGQYTGAGFIGRGVDVSTVSRAVNRFLTSEVSATGSTAAADRMRADMLAQMQDAFGTGTAGLGYATTQLFAAWSDLASHPDDMSARQVVLARADDLASATRSTSDQLEELQTSVREEVQTSVAHVNDLANQVARLNQQIAATQGANQSPNDLLDQRDRVIDEISQYVQVTRVEQRVSDETVGTGSSSSAQRDGAINLFIGSGQSLVVGSSAYKLEATPDEFEPAKVSLSINVAGARRPLTDTSLGGGSLAGLMAFQNQDLTDARNQLGRLAASLATEVNNQQKLGQDLSGQPGSALFSVGAPNVIASGKNSVSALPSLAITDPRALQASDYLLSADASAGSYTLTRLSDGAKTLGVTSGQTVDGFRITIGTPAPAAGDRFLLQPSTNAAQGLSLALDSPKGLAAANPFVATAGAANTGTATVASLAMTGSPGASYQSMQLDFTDSTGGYTLSTLGGGTLVSGTWSPGSPISYNGVELTLSGVPKAGDKFGIALTSNSASSNGNALAMVALGNRGVVDGANLADAYSHILSDVGVRVQSANSAVDVSSAVAARAKEALASETGVNLDEEAAKLIQYQQSYQAAAKILQVAQKIFDTVLGMAN